MARGLSMRSSGAVALVALAIGVALIAVTGSPVSRTTSGQAQAADTPLRWGTGAAQYELLVNQHQDMEYEQLRSLLYEHRDYVSELSFDPTEAKYFDRIRDRLELTKEEVEIFKANGFVSSDQQQRYSFPSAYYEVYRSDLPVFVTSDSILHALHRSFDNVLMELEVALFRPMLESILADCHDLLFLRYRAESAAALRPSCRDVDLYLTVARNLLADSRSAQLVFNSKFDQDGEVQAVLADIESLKIQVPDVDPPTSIYGGTRYLDYSQFKPRGHYTKLPSLPSYFRCMMWLGRADCGWIVFPPDPVSSVVCDADRELRNAALLTELLEASGGSARLATIDKLMKIMVGQSDNLTPPDLAGQLQAGGIEGLADLREPDQLERLRNEIRSSEQARQMIRSQVITSSPYDEHKVPPPDLFQMFGQRFIIDSFVLSHQVFDSIIYQHQKQRRMMPTGLDVMAALGNSEAIPLLEDELRRWNYSANLMAGREFIDMYPPAFWQENLYNNWLECLRVLDDVPLDDGHFPETMRTQNWQMKQLQTQLASWAELRHDTLLYAKQSYTGVPLCQYPTGYVEPYPELYERLRTFAEQAVHSLTSVEFGVAGEQTVSAFTRMREKHVAFFQGMAGIMVRLETISRKELRAQPLADDEEKFLEQLIDQRGSIRIGSGGRARYDGWYCDLIYGDRANVMDWVPVIADVHTDPESRRALEVGTGDVNLCIIAIDSENDLAAYVGPVYSYYEFLHPAEDRLTDEAWQFTFLRGETPSRPNWVERFQASPAKRPRHSR